MRDEASGFKRSLKVLQRDWGDGLPLGAVCFATSVVVYLCAHLVGLTAYPVSFLGDEAVQVLNAGRLAENGFRDEYGDLLPTYLRNGPYLNLGLSVYLQLVPYWLFGYSELAARAVTALVTLSGAAALALTLRDVFRVRLWWTAVLLLSAVPAWFLHSRTALEAPIGCSFYAWFLALYLRFRVTETPLMLYGAVVSGGLAFYSYAPLKVVVVVTATLFVLSDARWLYGRRDVCLRASLLVAAIALPELRFQLAHPGANVDQLRVLGSYVVDPELGVAQKVRRYVHEHAVGLSPTYWYDRDETRELSRHAMKGYGNVLLATAPFALIGLVRTVARVRDARYRAVLLATAAAPSGPALVHIALPRSLVVVVPLTLLTAFGLDAVATASTRLVREPIVAVATLVILCALNVGMLTDSVRNGPRWYDNYGLSGAQFGGREIAEAVREELERRPDQHVVVTSGWGNASNLVLMFFLPGEPRVRVENPAVVTAPRSLRADLERTLFVVTADELELLRSDPLYETPLPVRSIALPDGRPGFFLVRLRYSPRAASIVATRRLALQRPVTERAIVRGTRARVTHPPFDIGALEALFDEDTFTLARTADANVMELEIAFDSPIRMRRIRVVGAEPTLAVEAEVTAIGAATPRPPKRVVGRPGQAAVVVTLAPRALKAERLVLRVSDPTAGADPHVHVREVVIE